MAAIAELVNDHVFNKSKETVDFSDKNYNGKIVGFYFSAHWCPPCRRFTPILIDFYEKYHQEKHFEIIFVSSDDDEESFDEYYKDMPWLTVDHNQEDLRDKLSETFHVDGIPQLTFIDADSGEILCQDARGQIQSKDKDGKNFPWKNEKDEKEEDEDEE